MKKTLLSLIFLIFLFGPGTLLRAQISEGGIPPSFTYEEKGNLKQSKPSYSIPVLFDIENLKSEDKINEQKGWPLRTAIVIPSDIDIFSEGNWSTLENGQKILRYMLEAQGATALMLYYDEFYIPEGGKLFIYSNDKQHVLGAYGNKTNPKGGSFASEFVKGDKLTLEYVAPVSDTNDVPRIKISGVGYGYNYINIVNQTYNSGNLGASSSCMVNINCSEGNHWQNQKRGVIMSIAVIDSSSYLCSGTVINNTAQDLTPYLLTSHQCFHINGKECDDYDKIVYYFDFEHPGCENLNIDPENTKTLVGAQKLVDIPEEGGSDGILLKLLEVIPEDYDVFYNGWDKSSQPPQSGVTIHHPMGDVKKISTFSAEATSATWNSGSNEFGAENGHWNVAFVATENGFGATESGSSGAPLFNQNGLIVGTLTSSSGGCLDPGGRNLFGKLNYHWDKYSDATQQMSKYLDPLNTGQETLNGTYLIGGEPKADFMASTTEIYALQTITYIDKSVNASSYKWTFEGGTPASSTDKNPPAVSYGTPGIFETMLVINEGLANEKTKTITITVSEKGGTAVTPKANFALGENIVFAEGFDSETTFPPTGWSIEQKSAEATAGWIANNFKTGNFDKINPESKYSAYIKWSSKESDAWLKSSKITIPDRATLEFYAGYTRYYVEAASLSFYISTDEGLNWDLIWTNANEYEAVVFDWYKIQFDLSEYSGQEIMLAWQYKGKNGDSNTIDGIKITSPTQEPVTIKVGESISPVDISTGPPVLWNWTFEGGVPATSDKERPVIQYNTPGVYDVTLTVKNTKGEDTYTLQEAVTVVDIEPIVNFKADKGFIRQEDYGLFIPTGTSVNFEDRSKNLPTTWNWTFTGATPSSSSDQNPTGINYPVAGKFDLKLQVSNTAGSDQINTNVNVGYGTDKIWNMPYGETGTSVVTSDLGYVTGTNTNGISAYAERFDEPITTVGYVSSVDILFHVENSSSTGVLKVSIAGAGESSYPGNNLVTVDLPVSSINTDGYTSVTFDEPVMVDGHFFVVVDGFKTYAYDIAIKSAAIDSEKNTTYLYSPAVAEVYGNGWYTIGGIYSMTQTSLNIVPEFTYGTFKVTSDKIIEKTNDNQDVETIVVESNVDWKTTTNESWINVSDEVHTGSGSVTFTVSKNDGYPRNGVIIVSAGNTVKDYILVRQAGASPASFAVEPTAKPGVVKLAWEEPAFDVLPFADIYDGAEDHSDFTINSKGNVGWTYIDADGDYTWSITGIGFPNSSEPSAFRVFNPSAISAGTDYKPHTGDKYFASFASVYNNTDDWMISPELFFKSEFKLSFWAKAFSESYTEKLRVLYSTENNKPSDFVNNLAGEPEITLTTEWTKFEYTLPENAKYVALNNVSKDGFILFVDDIFIGVGEAPVFAQRKDIAVSNGIKADRINPMKVPTTNQEDNTGTLISVWDVTDKNNSRLVRYISPEAAPYKTADNNLFRIVWEDKAVQPALKNAKDESNYLFELGWDNGVNFNRIGKREGGLIEIAILFDPTDLVQFHKSTIEEVKFYLWSVPQDGITLKVRKNNEIVYSQKVESADLRSNSYNKVKLSSPITIDATQYIHIGYEYVQSQGLDYYVAGCDRGPAVIGKGDLISDNGSAFSALGSRNWNLGMLVKDIRNNNFDLSYNVLRNGTNITRTEELSVEDEPQMSGDIQYTLIALYNNELSTTPLSTNILMPAAPENLQGEVVEKDVKLTWSASADADSYNIYRDGSLVAENISSVEYLDPNLENGEYCYTVAAKNPMGFISAETNQVCVLIDFSGIDTSKKENQFIYADSNNILKILGFQGYEANIFTIDGRLVADFKVDGNDYSYPLDMQVGVYVVKIWDNLHSVTERIIIN